jgi:hypothetical protein
MKLQCPKLRSILNNSVKMDGEVLMVLLSSFTMYRYPSNFQLVVLSISGPLVLVFQFSMVFNCTLYGLAGTIRVFTYG